MKLGKVVVGSRLHGLNKRFSDYDVRTIKVTPGLAYLDTFAKGKYKPESGTWELANFIHFLRLGHPRAIEVLLSDIVKDTTPEFDEMRENWKKFVDSEEFAKSSKIYATNQVVRVINIEDRRTPKFAVAAMLTLIRITYFYQYGEYMPRLTEPVMIYFLKGLRKWKPEYRNTVVSTFATSWRILTEATPKEHFKPDEKYIEKFVNKVYEGAKKK